ncbi:organic cation transporter protein [Aplysia californica]|uniref:Organic cation transporter protein n=1 Tax=Aplysia californica TaxID=6500 RepID=A0ABM1A5K1_APLCA|nr:organic cation transporter protein [Aplysia californica]
MKYDDILQEIGDFGPYQKRVYYILCLPSAVKAVIIMSTVFLFSLPDYECVSSGIHLQLSDLNPSLQSLVNSTSDLMDTTYASSSSAHPDHCWVPTQIEIPLNVTISVNVSAERLLGSHVTALARTGVPEAVKCQEWRYDRSEIESSIMTEFNFVCDKSMMRSHANMGLFLASLVGALVIGILADIIGRKKALLFCVALQLGSCLGTFFAQTAVAVVVLRSVQGLSGEMFPIAASTGMELLGQGRRTFAGTVVQFFWSAGQLLVLLVAYVSGGWRVQELVYAACAVPLFLAVWLWTPESPRWLIDKDRQAEATDILEKIATSNKTKLPENALQNKDELYDTEESVLTIIRSRTLLIMSLVVLLNWFTVNVLYYGLSLNLENLSGSLYLNFLISLSVEVAGFAFCYVLLDRAGRKALMIGCMFVGSLACLCVTFPVVFGNADQQWIVTTLCMVGKMCVGSCYAILFIMSVELFPTVVRNSALGACMVFENVAGMVAPYITDLGLTTTHTEISQAVPLLVFGGLGVVTAIASLYLPETLGKPLPETFQDAIDLSSGGKNKKERQGEK